MANTLSQIVRGPAMLLLAVPLVALLGVFGWLWGISFIHGLVIMWMSNAAVLVPLTISLVLAGIVYFLSRSFGAVIVIASVGLITGILMASLVAPYQVARHYFEDSTVTETDSVPPSYAERAPAEVATRTSNNALMNITGDSVLTRSLADEGDNGEWNTLIVERGMFKGYEVVQNLSAPLFGTAQNKDVKFCEFSDDAKLRDGGAVPSNNLARSIWLKVPLTVGYNSDDIYSYCNDSNEPMVVVPLVKVSGFMFTTWKPYGLATYNGSTGELEILKDADSIKEIPGQVYPLSLATEQRESLIANGSWWEMYGERVSGFVAATENPEVNLRRIGGNATDFVTPLMPRGSSTSLVATSHVPSSTMIPGEYNMLTVSEYPSENVRPANSTLIDELKTRYSYMPDIANDTIKVFEITSGKDGGWVVSLGREQSVNYRAYVSPSGDTVELFDRNGTLIAQGSASSGSEEEASSEDSAGSVEWKGSDVSGLSTEELNDLGRSVMDELAKRTK